MLRMATSHNYSQAYYQSNYWNELVFRLTHKENAKSVTWIIGFHKECDYRVLYVR